MSIIDKLIPDYYFNTIYDITPELMSTLGIHGLILDIDNTLVTYDDPEPIPSVLEWFDSMLRVGIKISFVSNNHAERVETFNSRLGYYALADSGKPFGDSVMKAMNAMHTSVSDTLIIGDQIFTDVYAGKRVGLKAILVDPIKDKTTLFFRFKRLLEKPLKRRKGKDI